MNIKTRNGLFANEGYGGGVFNYNTAFGSVPADQEYAIAGLGALPADRPLPGDCWDNPGFKDCHAVAWNEARSKCEYCKDHQDDPQCLMFTTVDDCINRVANNTTWDLCMSLYCREKDPNSTTPLAFKPYKAGDPCNAKNTIQNVQHRASAKADGIWGPMTQSAYDTMVRVQGTKYCDLVPGCSGPTPMGGNCGSTAPVPAPTNPAPPVFVPEEDDEEPLEPPPAASQANMYMIGGVLLLGGLAAYALTKKKGRR